MNHRIEETIARDMCIGCGACNLMSNGSIPLTLTARGLYRADLAGVSIPDRNAGSKVCPFSDDCPDEDTIAEETLPQQARHHPLIGRHTRTYVGRVSDETYLQQSSSGGLTSWLTRTLLENGEIDAVLDVGRPGPSDTEIFGYDSTDSDTAAGRRKSHYYATTMADALRLAERSSLRFALVGVPCFIKAARAVCRERPELNERLRFFVALVCGHYKTQAYAQSLAWQLGIEPCELADVDFRVKDPQRPANQYLFGARRTGEELWRYRVSAELIGTNWGHCAFQPQACNFCDDVVGETSDISFGDAWLPQYVADGRGTNVVISRNTRLDAILADGVSRSEICLTELTADEVAKSQAGGFRHRREGLALRLADDEAANLSVPRKRVAPDASVANRRRRRLIRQRRRIAAFSHEVFAEAVATQDLQHYLDAMAAEVALYRRIESGMLRTVYRWLRHLVRRRRPAARAPLASEVTPEPRDG